MGCYTFALHFVTESACKKHDGAKASACVYSLVETAKANGLNPYKYLEFLLTRLPGSNYKTNSNSLDLMMPWDELIQTTCKAD
ncbi:transposase domain-containing protein [Clostridium aceticum]|uniref:transposase domain-containing protein n=1 Tax=Clostridium aceticum TaxID=84022 RepID=UPI003BFA7114